MPAPLAVLEVFRGKAGEDTRLVGLHPYPTEGLYQRYIGRKFLLNFICRVHDGGKDLYKGLDWRWGHLQPSRCCNSFLPKEDTRPSEAGGAMLHPKHKSVGVLSFAHGQGG